MAGSKKPNTVAVATQLAEPVIEEMGLMLWDVRYEKEGSSWYLRYFIEKEGGVTIDDCEAFSRRMSDILDEADPISQSYYLEVGSPGLGCKLTRDAHFAAKRGQKVLAHLIRPDGAGRRDIAGILGGKEGPLVTLALEDGTQAVVDQKDASYFKLCDDEDLF